MTNEARRIRLEICLAADTQAKPETRLLPGGSEQRFCAASIRSETTSGSRYAIGHTAVSENLAGTWGNLKNASSAVHLARYCRPAGHQVSFNHDPAYLSPA